MGGNLKIGMLVWAKMKGFSPWPGLIIEPKEHLKKNTKKSDQYCIFFFGSKNYGFLEESSITPYQDAKPKLINSSKSGPFKEAVHEIEDFILNQKANPDFSLDDFLGDLDKSKTFDRIKANDKKPTPKRKKETTPKAASVTSKSSAKKAKLAARDEDSSPVRSISNHVSSKNYEQILNRPVVERPRTPLLDLNKVSQSLREKDIEPSSKVFGFIGLGVMGSGIVKNLINSGHKLNLWNRTLRKAEDIKEQADKNQPGQVTVYQAPYEVVENSDIIFCCVSDALAIKNIVFANCGLLSQQDGTFEGKGYVELSSIDTDTSNDISTVITDKGGRYLEAQLQGSKVEADDGSLIVLGAGDKTLFDDCQSCFQAMGKTAFYLGGVGFAIKMNLVLQVMRGVALAGLTEGFVLAERSGLALKDVKEILSITTMNSPTILEKAEIIISSDYRNPRMPLQHMQKDLRYALELSDNVQQPMIMTSAANEAFKHARRLGYDKHDSAAVYMRALH